MLGNFLGGRIGSDGGPALEALFLFTVHISTIAFASNE